MPLQVNHERPLRPGAGNRSITEVVATDPASVVCPESIFVNAITSLGIPLVSYAEYRAEDPQRAGWTRKLVWQMEDKSIDSKYTFKQLRNWWHDAAWLNAHPSHELAIAHALSTNLLRMAERIRNQPYLIRFEEYRGNERLAANIPVNATPEQREQLLKIFGAS